MNVTVTEETTRWVKVDERLWLTADGQRLVPEGDRAAAQLYARENVRIPIADAIRYGLIETLTEPELQQEETPTRSTRRGRGRNAPSAAAVDPEPEQELDQAATDDAPADESQAGGLTIVVPDETDG